MSQAKSALPKLFKGIALFTPGGDYNKQGRWHLHLCAGLQEILDLPEPPHFLVPCYTATIERASPNIVPVAPGGLDDVVISMYTKPKLNLA